MKIEESLQHFKSSNTQEKRLDIAASKWKEQTYMLACEWKLLLHHKSPKKQQKDQSYFFFLLLSLHLSTFKVVYHYKIICKDVWGPNFVKKPHGNI